MKDTKINVWFYSGYGGVPKCEVELNGEKFVLEIKEIEERLEKQILEKGHTVSKTNRQKYKRLHINE